MMVKVYHTRCLNTQLLIQRENDAFTYFFPRVFFIYFFTSF